MTAVMLWASAHAGCVEIAKYGDENDYSNFRCHPRWEICPHVNLVWWED